MATIPEITDRLEAATEKAENASQIIYDVANGDASTEVPTASGPTPTLKKWFQDLGSAVEPMLAGIPARLDKSVLAYQTKVEADSAALSLPEGQLVDVLAAQERYRVNSGSLVFAEFLSSSPVFNTYSDLRSAPAPSKRTVAYVSGRSSATDKLGGNFVWTPASSVDDNNATVIKPASVTGSGRWIRGGKLRPEWFGAIGNGSTDDADAFNAMFSALPSQGWGEIELDPRKEYAIGKPVTTSARFACSSHMRFVGIGNEPSYSDTLINFNTDTDISRIDVRLASGSVWHRVLRPGRGSIGVINVTSPSLLVGYLDAAGAAVTFSFDSRTVVDSLYVTGFQQTVTIRYTDDIKINNLYTGNSYRGVRINNGTRIQIGRHLHFGATQDWTYASGAFGQDLEDVTRFRCDYVETHDTTSHGVRVSGNTDYASRYLSWGTMLTYSPGRCGFKLQGAANSDDPGTPSPPTWIADVTIGELYVTDAGKLCDNYLISTGGVGEFSDNGTGPAGGANEYCVSLIKSRRVQIGNLTTRKVHNTYASGSAGLSIRSCKQLDIKIDVSDSYYYGIKMGASEETLDGINIYGKITRIGTWTDNTTTGDPITSKNTRGDGVWAWAGSVTSLNNILLDLNITNSRRGIYHRATSFPEPTILKGVIARCFTGVDDQSPSSNNYINLVQNLSPR